MTAAVESKEWPKPERVRAARERSSDRKARRKFLPSAPTLRRFSPEIPWQREVLKFLRREWDYSKGTPEVLLSGAYGSAKSIVLAHLAVTHCLQNRGARVAIGRRARPDLKQTLYAEILEHIGKDLVEGVDYWTRQAQGYIKFRNGSEIVPAYWADRRYKRFRSLKLSMVIIEELTENDDEDEEAVEELMARLRRIPGIKENVFIAATNPDSPAHWVYKRYIEPNEDGKQHPTRRVWFSRADTNPFLDPVYVRQLRANMDAKRARRYLDGEWIELTKDRVYYSYSSEQNYRQTTYDVRLDLPIHVTWDFNIGVGKPLSCTFFQYWPEHDQFHFFDEVIVEGVRTEEALEEAASRKLFDYATRYIVNGDASGKNRDTRSKKNDYQIILEFFARYQRPDGSTPEVQLSVPVSNPPLRNRHNTVNAYCVNGLGVARMFVYSTCPTLHRGMRLTELKKGGLYTEDDSKEYQHVTTAAGYGIMSAILLARRKPQGTREL